MRSKEQTSCFSGWIHYLLIASTTKLLITFTYQSSGHRESPCLVLHLHRTKIWALIWRPYLQDKAEPMDGGSRAEGMVAQSMLLCSLAS